MKITGDTKPCPLSRRPTAAEHYWGLMSDGDELPDFSANYADAFFGVNAGTASGGGGRAAAPAAATAQGSVRLLPPPSLQWTPWRRSSAWI